LSHDTAQALNIALTCTSARISGAVPPTTLAEGIPTILSPTERLNIRRDAAPDLSARKVRLKADKGEMVGEKLGLDMPSAVL
jgi:hypothetical protein